MLKLFETFSTSNIIIFVILLAFAIKEAVVFYDWAKGRIKQSVNEKQEEEQEKSELEEKLDDMEKLFQEKERRFDEKKNEINGGFAKLESQIAVLTKNLEMLISSDRDSIKSYITEKHHYFCYEQKWIDDYNLDCIERRFSHYIEEGGNSFIKELMMDIRALPRRPQ